MGLIQHVWPWDAQPQEVRGPSEWARSLGIVALSVPHHGVEVVSGNTFTRVATPTITAGRDGVGVTTNGTTSGLYCRLPKQTVNEFTLFAIQQASSPGTDTRSLSLGDSASDQTMMMLNTSSVTASRMRLFVRNAAGSSLVVDGTSISPYDGSPHAIAMTYGTAGGFGYSDGERETNTLPGTITGFTFDQFAIGLLRRTGNASFWSGSTFLAAAFTRQLSAVEIRQLGDRPWDLFEPRRIWVPVSAGGGGATGGSQATVHVTAAGAGYAAEFAVGGSQATVHVTAAGAGTALESAAGGSQATVHVTAAGAGTALESAAGGSGSAVEVSATGAGVATEVASGGSGSAVEVSAAGAGYAAEFAVGGSQATVHVTAAGAGTALESAAGGSASAVEVSAAGAGSAQEEGSASGGSASTVEITTAGAGTAVEAASGGSASAVHVTATGAGVAAEVASGGSSSAVEVASVGGGAAQQDGAATGGSSSVVIVTSTGGGYAIEFAFGGSQSTVTVNSTGAGQAEESGDNQAGGSASMAVVLAAGAGYATEFAVGGSSSIVQVRAVGYGFAPNTQPRVLSIFERMSATILRTLGKPAYYNGSTEPVMINIEHDVQMAGMGAEQAAYRGDYVANRDIATVPMDLNPRVGDRFVQDGVLWRLESLYSDKGANRRFVVSRVKT